MALRRPALRALGATGTGGLFLAGHGLPPGGAASGLHGTAPPGCRRRSRAGIQAQRQRDDREDPECTDHRSPPEQDRIILWPPSPEVGPAAGPALRESRARAAGRTGIPPRSAAPAAERRRFGAPIPPR